MKKLLLFSIAFIGLTVCLTSIVNAQGVGINPSGSNPDNSSGLDVDFTTKGVLIPRMNSVQRDAIASPAKGLLIFNTDCNTINFWNGGAWVPGYYNSTFSAPPVFGSTSVCANNTGVYSCFSGNGTTFCSWSVPPGSSIVSGQGTTSITVKFGAVSGNICVAAGNNCGIGAQSCLSTTVYPSIPTAPAANFAGNTTSSSFNANWSATAFANAYYLDVATDAAFTAIISGYNNLNVGNVTTYNVTGLTLPTGCSGTPAYYYRVRAGNTCGISGNSNTIYVANNVTLWTQTENPTSGTDLIKAMALDATGIYVAGTDNSPGHSEWRIEKRDLSSGALITSFGNSGVITENPSSNNDLNVIALDGTGMYVAGYDFAPGDAEWRIEKRDLTTGALITSFGNSGVITENISSRTDQVLAIALNGTGVYAAGYDGIPGNGEWRIEKRDLSTGALITSFGTNGIITLNPSANEDDIYGIALDATGVYVAGNDGVAGGYAAWKIEKRDLSTGAVIWTQTEPTVSGFNNFIYAIALDATGVYLAGVDAAGGGIEEYRIEKRDLSTGAVIWTQTENPSPGNYNALYAITLDATAVYMAGYAGIGGSQQWRTEKRDLSTGAVVWKNDRIITSSEINAITLDATGVYMAGYDGVPGNREWRIEKYCK